MAAAAAMPAPGAAIDVGDDQGDPSPQRQQQQLKQRPINPPPIGTIVCVKGFGKARVVSAPAPPGAPFAGRVRVERVVENAIGSDGGAAPPVTGLAAPATRHVHLRELRPLRTPPGRVVAVSTTRDYRAAACAFVHPGDGVLEVGSAQGLTLALLASHAAGGGGGGEGQGGGGFAVGVDKSEAMAADAAARGGPRVAVADAFDVAALAALSPRWRPPVVAAAGATATASEQPQQQQHQQEEEDEEEEEDGQADDSQQHEQQQQRPKGRKPPPRLNRRLRERARPSAAGHLSALAEGGRLYDKIFVDVGGIAELATVMALVGLYYRSFPGATIVVKSKYLAALLGQSAVWAPPG